MMAEYAACYGGPPLPTMAWRLFLALVSRADQFYAREVMATMDAASLAISASISKDGARALQRARSKISKAAWPVKDAPDA